MSDAIKPRLFPISWREANVVTDEEFAEIGVLLCDHTPRDLALMIVRLRYFGLVSDEKGTEV